MIWRFEIKDKPGIFDAAGDSVLKDILDCGIHSVKEVGLIQVYWVEGGLNEAQARRIARELLVDGIVQDYNIFNAETLSAEIIPGYKTVEIAYNPGVMDHVEESTLKGIRDLGISSVSAVRTARKYLIHGHPTDKELDFIINKVLMNKLIQHVVKTPEMAFRSLLLEAKSSSAFDVIIEPYQSEQRSADGFEPEGPAFSQFG